MFGDKRSHSQVLGTLRDVRWLDATDRGLAQMDRRGIGGGVPGGSRSTVAKYEVNDRFEL